MVAQPPRTKPWHFPSGVRRCVSVTFVFRLVSLCFQATGTSFFDCRVSSVQCRHGDRETRTAIVVGASSFCFVSNNYSRLSAPACTQRSILLVSLTSLTPLRPPTLTPTSTTSPPSCQQARRKILRVFEPHPRRLRVHPEILCLWCLPTQGGLCMHPEKLPVSVVSPHPRRSVYASRNTTLVCCVSPTLSGLCMHPEILPVSTL